MQVVDAPEILTVIDKIPNLSDFLNALYGCQYKSFFIAFGKFSSHLSMLVYNHSLVYHLRLQKILILLC